MIPITSNASFSKTAGLHADFSVSCDSTCEQYDIFRDRISEPHQTGALSEVSSYLSANITARNGAVKQATRDLCHAQAYKTVSLDFISRDV